MLPWRILGLLVLAAAGFVAAVALLPDSPDDLRELVDESGASAPLIALSAWVVLAPAGFPLPLMAAAGGLAFGAPGGAALAVLGALAGGLTAFALGRTAARRTVESLVGRRRRIARLHALIERRGFASVLAARLMPGVPVWPVHYVAGASPVAVGAFAAAMAVGALLRLVPYALLGDGFGSGSTASIVVAAGSMLVGGTTALLLLRHLRRTAAAAAA